MKTKFYLGITSLATLLLTGFLILEVNPLATSGFARGGYIKEQ